MYTTIKKSRISQAIRLPKGLLEVALMRKNNNDRDEIRAENGCIIIRHFSKKHQTSDGRIADFNEDYNRRVNI